MGGSPAIGRGTKPMSDNAEGSVADAGRKVQERLNQADDTKEQLVHFIRENPITAVLLAVGIGYILGKVS
jgi:ElaB/YqjD/DUF883 family membrane-anchored ribosome-binding protein